MIRLTFYPCAREAQPPDPDDSDDENLDPNEPRARFGAYTAYTYPLHAHSLMKIHCAPQEGGFRVLAGSFRTVAYCVPKADRTAAPKLWRMYRYYDPASRKPTAENGPHGVWHGPQSVLTTLEVPEEVTSKRVEALAWDETIGRLCVAFEGEQTVTVLDYAKAPRHGQSCYCIFAFGF